MTRARFVSPSRRRFLKLALTGGLFASAACRSHRESPIRRAEFGVFFGGQVQERTEIPFDLDANHQTLGFVIELSSPPAAPMPLHWEVSKPSPVNHAADPMKRRVELFDAVVPPGETVVSKTVKLEPGDGLGLWNIRVTLDDHLAIDRAFIVHEPSSRPPRRRRKARPIHDAGL